jgi:hypothetical protein
MSMRLRYRSVRSRVLAKAGMVIHLPCLILIVFAENYRSCCHGRCTLCFLLKQTNFRNLARILLRHRVLQTGLLIIFGKKTLYSIRLRSSN